MKTKKQNLNSGFVALFTVLLASVILAMAVGISNISLKQIVLSASASDANKSFYAADSGIECALFNDLRATPNPFSTNAANMTCGGSIIALSEPLPGISTFSLDLATESGLSCANVTVDKTDLLGGTKITSKGINGACGTTSPRLVERAIEVTY